MNDNFLLYRNVKEFSIEMMKYSDNIPRNLMHIKLGIQKSFDNAVRLIRYYIVNASESYRIKIKYLKDLVVEISMLDYYLECLFNFRVLGRNRYSSFSSQVESIRKITYGVITNEKKSCQV